MRTVLFACALFALAGAASAQESPPQSIPAELPAPTTGPEISFNVALTSDYVFRGISQTDEEIALQAGADLVYSSLYAGVWGSNVDFGDDTEAEFDLYAGVRPEVAGFSLDFGVIYYGYLGQPDDANWDFFEAKAAVSRGVGPATVGAALFYSPEFTGETGEALYAEVNGSVAVHPRVTLTGAVGNQDVDLAGDYTTWNLGAVLAATDVFSVDLRYWDTDLEDLDIAEERIVLTLKAAF